MFQAPLSTKRGLFRLAVLVGVDRESARAGFVVDLYVEAERCAFNVGSSESAEHADVIRGELAAELNRHESTQENWQRLSAIGGLRGCADLGGECRPGDDMRVVSSRGVGEPVVRDQIGHCLADECDSSRQPNKRAGCVLGAGEQSPMGPGRGGRAVCRMAAESRRVQASFYSPLQHVVPVHCTDRSAGVRRGCPIAAAISPRRSA